MTSYAHRTVPRPVVTDLTIGTTSPLSQSSLQLWHRIDKELYLHHGLHQETWLYLAVADEQELTNEDLVVVEVEIGDKPPTARLGCAWENRPGGIWVMRTKFPGIVDQALTKIDVLFGEDAVEPRPDWTLIRAPLNLNVQQRCPVARLSILKGRVIPKPRPSLKTRQDGTFRIVQISDTHMVTGVGECKDALDAHGHNMDVSEADPLTVAFIGRTLDHEKPDLVVLTGDQLHHDIPDSQSALFKVFNPIIERSIPFAAVFGNHDSEGQYALSRQSCPDAKISLAFTAADSTAGTTQMSILQDMPFSLCEPGPDDVDGIGNFVLQVLASESSNDLVSTLYFLDSHSGKPSETHNPDYEPIKKSQIDWLTNVARTQRATFEEGSRHSRSHLALAFIHIPLPEFSDTRLKKLGGQQREPPEGPSVNSHFYDALKKEGVSALGCGHDHVNDFCGLLEPNGPWLCYAGGSGFGGYGEYGGIRQHRRMRVWEIDTVAGTLKTWKRVEYAAGRVDELVLVRNH